MPIVSIPIQEGTPIGEVRYQDLINWLSNNCQGMYEVKTTYGSKKKIWSVVVSFINDKDAALFKLRWS